MSPGIDGATRDAFGRDAPLRILVGPYHLPDHWQYMCDAFDDHDAITFGTGKGVDLPARSVESIQSIMAKLPERWQPDLLILWRPEYGAVPHGLEDLDIPVVMLTSDWYLEFSDCVETARFVNCVVTGTRGERVFKAAGFSNVLNMPMLGYEPGVDDAFPDVERDIDVFYAGSTNWSAHARREHLLDKLLDLPASVNLVYRSQLSREEYGRYMARSKIAFNVTVIGEVNMRVYEGCAAGNCLFVEEENLDIRDMLVDGESVVLYNDENLVEKVLYYLAHEEERAAIAQRGRDSLQTKTYRASTNAILDTLREIGRERLMGMGREINRAGPLDRIRHYLPANLRYSFDDTASLRQVVAPLKFDPSPRDRLLSSVVDYAVAVSEWRAEHMRRLESQKLGLAVSEMIKACEAAPDDVSIAFNLAAYARHHAEPQGALQLMDRLIRGLEAAKTIPFAGTAFYAIEPNDDLRRRFERRAWEAVEEGLNPGSVLRPMLLDRVHQWKAEILYGIERYEEAVKALLAGIEAAPAETMCRPGAAKLLARLGRHHEVVPICQEHLTDNPLHTETWLVLAESQIQIQDTAGALATLDRLIRIHDTFGDEVGCLQIQNLRRRVERARPTARAAVLSNGS